MVFLKSEFQDELALCCDVLGTPEIVEVFFKGKMKMCRGNGHPFMFACVLDVGKYKVAGSEDRNDASKKVFSRHVFNSSVLGTKSLHYDYS